MNTLLCRLPVKPLLGRSRCTMSKTLYFHTDTTTTTTTTTTSSFVREDEIFPKGENFVIRKYPVGDFSYSVNVNSMCDFTATKIVDDLHKTYLLDSCFIGSCDGLVCLWKPGEDDIFLWNPTTEEIQILPKAINLTIPRNLLRSWEIGFGYDHVSDDYKVIKIANSHLVSIMVSVYSLKNNSWTLAESISTGIDFYGPFGYFANGSLYWLSEDTNNIYAFDLGVHKHKNLPLPAGVSMKNVDDLFVFNRCLGLVDCCRGSHMNIWMMNNNGMESSWSKLFSVEKPEILDALGCVYPVAFSKAQNEVLLAVDKERLVWYDCETKKVRHIELHGFPKTFNILVCGESHFQISDWMGSNQKKKKNEQREKTLNDCLNKCGFKFDDSGN